MTRTELRALHMLTGPTPHSVEWHDDRLILNYLELNVRTLFESGVPEFARRHRGKPGTP
jgi:hypothetical protein